MSGKTKEKLNIRFKFNDTIGEEKSDEILFRVFDVLLNSQNSNGVGKFKIKEKLDAAQQLSWKKIIKKELKKAEKINENNGNTNNSD